MQNTFNNRKYTNSINHIKAYMANQKHHQLRETPQNNASLPRGENSEHYLFQIQSNL